ncbi:MAG: hypothetical protein C3F02_03170, partial [Parcubacteria group bacterium]
KISGTCHKDNDPLVILANLIVKYFWLILIIGLVIIGNRLYVRYAGMFYQPFESGPGSHYRNR